MAKNNKFSPAQRRAFNSGMGYSVAHNKKEIVFTSQDLKDSFMAGYKAGTKKIKSSPKKYPPLGSGRKEKN